jgi:hypothetical protein
MLGLLCGREVQILILSEKVRGTAERNDEVAYPTVTAFILRAQWHLPSHSTDYFVVENRGELIRCSGSLRFEGSHAGFEFARAIDSGI